MLALGGFRAPRRRRLAVAHRRADKAMIARFQSRERVIRADRSFRMVRRRSERRQEKSEQEGKFSELDFHGVIWAASRSQSARLLILRCQPRPFTVA